LPLQSALHTPRAQMQATHAAAPLRSGGKVVQRSTETPVRCALMSGL
jgi:hypothetical protein